VTVCIPISITLAGWRRFYKNHSYIMTIRLFSESLVFQCPQPISGHLHQTNLITTPDRKRGLKFEDKTNYIIFTEHALPIVLSLNNGILIGIFKYLPRCSKIKHIFSNFLMFFYLKSALRRYKLLFF